MTTKESDLMMETTYTGMLQVTIAGMGRLRIEAVEESLRSLTNQVAAFLTGEITISSVSSNPWLIVSYEKDKSRLVVKPKAK